MDLPQIFISNRKGGHTGFYVDVLFAKSDISLSKWQKNRSRLNKPIFFFPLSVQFKRRFWIHFFANQAWFLSLFSKKGHQSQSNEKSFGWKNTFFLRRTFCVCPHVVGKIGFGRYAGVLRGPVFSLDGSLFLSQSVWQDDWPERLRAYVVCNGLRPG